MQVGGIIFACFISSGIKFLKNPHAPWKHFFGQSLKTYFVSHAGGQAKNKKAHTLALRYELS